MVTMITHLQRYNRKTSCEWSTRRSLLFQYTVNILSVEFIEMLLKLLPLLLDTFQT